MYPILYSLVSLTLGFIALLKRNDIKWITIVVVLLFLIFRDTDILPDYRTYVGYYSMAVNGVVLFVEPTFIIGAKFIYSLGLGHDVLFISYIVLAFVFQVIYINRTSRDFSISMLVLVSHFLIWYDLIQIRNALALSLFYYATTVVKSKYKSALFLMTMLIHYSMIVLVPVFYLFKKFGTKLLLIMIVLAYIIFLFEIRWIDSLLQGLNMGIFENRLSAYSSTERVEHLRLSPFGFMVFYRLFMVVILVALSRENIRRVYFGGVVIYFVLWELPEIAVRISNGLLFSEIVLFSNLNFNKYRRFFLVTIFLALSIGNIFFTHAFKY